jgi:lipoyl(octanoyl) transferase
MLDWEWTFLGSVPYDQALAMQYAYARKVATGARPRLFLLEHPPTLTLGRTAKSDHLRLSADEYRQRGIGIYRVFRGGGVTYHGPGQLVGYPVACLDRVHCSVPQWVRGHAEAIVQLLKRYQLDACWSRLQPGVWVNQRKIASLGFHLCRRISTHGFAVNLTTDLSYFETIIACGLSNLQTTSLAALGVYPPEPQQAAEELACLVAGIFGGRLCRRVEPAEVFEESIDVVASVA